MDTLQKNKTNSKEEDAQMRKMRLQAVLKEVEKIPPYDRFPRKYKSALEHVVYQKLRKLFEENPNMPLKEVVLHSLEGLNDDLPAHLLLHITQFTVKKWEKMVSEAMQQKSEMQLA